MNIDEIMIVFRVIVEMFAPAIGVLLGVAVAASALSWIFRVFMK